MPKKLTLGAEYHPQEAKKLLTILTLIFLEIYYGTDESKRPRPNHRAGCRKN